jgi:hypothetical protein
VARRVNNLSLILQRNVRVFTTRYSGSKFSEPTRYGLKSPTLRCSTKRGGEMGIGGNYCAQFGIPAHVYLIKRKMQPR